MIGITKDGTWLMYRDVEKIATGEWENGRVDKAIISPDTSIGGIIKMRERRIILNLRRLRQELCSISYYMDYMGRRTIQGLLELAKYLM